MGINWLVALAEANGAKAETWSPWIGCTPCSDGCQNCWAKREEDGRFNHLGRCMTREERMDTYDWHAGDGLLVELPYFWRGPVEQYGALEQPLHWRKKRVVFVGARTDIFHKGISFEEIDRIFAVMALCPQHYFLVLTKRAERMKEYTQLRIGIGHAGICWAINRIPANLGNRHGALHLPLDNVGLGLSVCNQPEADVKIPKLLACPAAMRFLSIEPHLGAIDLSKPCRPMRNGKPIWPCSESLAFGFDWIVDGGESGKNARPSHPDWFRKVRDDCVSAGVPYYFKQWGEWGPRVDNIRSYDVFLGDNTTWNRAIRRCLKKHHASDVMTPNEEDDSATYWYPSTEDRPQEHVFRVGKKAAGRMLDGREWGELPTIAKES